MRFRINVDYPTGRTTIHTVNNDRRCQPREKRPQDGGWLGPFATAQEATQAAIETGLRIHPCRLCNPQLSVPQQADVVEPEWWHYRGIRGSTEDLSAEETENYRRVPAQQELMITQAATELTQMWVDLEQMLLDAQDSGFSDEVVLEMRRYATEERIQALGAASYAQAVDGDPGGIYDLVYDIFRDMTVIQVEVFDALLRACDSRDPGDLDSAIASARYCQSLGEQALMMIPELAKLGKEDGSDQERGCIWGCVGVVVLVVLVIIVAAICG